jgi:hypothetical protein
VLVRPGHRPERPGADRSNICKGGLVTGRTALIAFAALMTSASGAHAQNAQPAPCTSSEHRQFDFWVGEWEVFSGDTARAGRNTITSEMGGCALREQWESAGGFTGSSLNIYDAATGRWHQTWVDSSGTLLLLDGSLEAEGRMVMSGERPGASGGTVLNRITWTRESADRVRQLWEVRTAPDAAWRAVFDGMYRRVR